MESLKDRIKRFLNVSYGSGYGYGDGSGDGDGSGSGSGDGYGYGSGSGSGSGSGDGLKSYNRQQVYYVDNVPTLIDNVKGMYAMGHIINGDKTLKPCYIARCGNYFAHGETLHEAQRDALAKFQQNMSEEERIAAFIALFLVFFCVAVMKESLLGIGLLLAIVFCVIWYANYRYGD